MDARKMFGGVLVLGGIVLGACGGSAEPERKAPSVEIVAAEPTAEATTEAPATKTEDACSLISDKEVSGIFKVSAESTSENGVCKWVDAQPENPAAVIKWELSLRVSPAPAGNLDDVREGFEALGYEDLAVGDDAIVSGGLLFLQVDDARAEFLWIPGDPDHDDAMLVRAAETVAQRL